MHMGFPQKIFMKMHWRVSKNDQECEHLTLLWSFLVNGNVGDIKNIHIIAVQASVYLPKSPQSHGSFHLVTGPSASAGIVSGSPNTDSAERQPGTLHSVHT